MTEKKTARAEIVRVLRICYPNPLAIHELQIEGYSQNNLATRMSFLASDGIVMSRVRKGEAFNEWKLTPEWVNPDRPVPPERKPARKAKLGLVIGIQGTLVPDFEDILVRVPKGQFHVGQEI